MGMVQIRHFEFLCQSMGIEPLVDRFRVFYQLHCSLGFYSFIQRSLVKKIFLTPPKSYQDWKSKFYFFRSGVILAKMEFRGADEISVETLETPVGEIWYQDIKEIPSIQLPERALVAVKMSFLWRADRRDKPREKGKVTTVQLDAGEKPWYHQIVKNFAFPKDAYLETQAAADVGIGPESKKKKRRPVASTAPKKADLPKADVPKAEKKKGMRLVSNSWFDYIVVSNSFEGLAACSCETTKVEPRDATDIQYQT
ncbi:hypothetical protein HanPI659440_Chr11g0429271 [Helianthus annuus]|nr:hypothetical protein HanPI659440_Chr11g0429271 [Helianthus annuus]